MPVVINSTEEKGIITIGACACLAMALVYLITTAIYIPGMRRGPAPTSVADWYSLFQEYPVTGLFYLGFADLVIAILYIPTALALRQSLSNVSKTWTLLAASIGFVGIAVFLATNAAFTMLSLSSEYSAASSDAGKSALLIAGQSIISTTKGSGNSIGNGLIWMASLVFSVLLIRNNRLGKACGWIGLSAFVLLIISLFLAGYTYGVSSPLESALALATSVGGGVLSFIWYILAAIWLFAFQSKRTEETAA